MTKGVSARNELFPGISHLLIALSAPLRRWGVCFIAGLLVMSFNSAQAQETGVPDVNVALLADREELTVGDLVTLTIEVSHPSDHTAVLPRLGSEWGPFEVRSQTPVRTEPGSDGISKTRKRFEVALFAPGEYETPSIPLSVRLPDGSVSQVDAPTVDLTVRSVLSGDDNVLRDIRSPADLSENFWDRPESRALVALAAVAALCVAAYFLYRRFRGDEESYEQIVDTRTPLEVATQELDRIERLDLPGNGEFKEHYTLISAALRAFLQGTYFEDAGGPSAEDMTTDEIVDALRSHSMGSGYLALVRDLLLEADLVKYSSYTPTASEAYGALVGAREILGEAVPEAATPPDSGPRSSSEAPA